MDSFDPQSAWPHLSADLRADIDSLIVERRMIQAIAAFLERAGTQPKPGLSDGRRMLSCRYEVLLAAGEINPDQSPT